MPVRRQAVSMFQVIPKVEPDESCLFVTAPTHLDRAHTPFGVVPGAFGLPLLGKLAREWRCGIILAQPLADGSSISDSGKIFSERRGSCVFT